MEFPIIDITSLVSGDEQRTKDVLAKQWDSALRIHGFALIVGHGVPETITEALYAEGKRFFALPTDDKRKCSFTETYGPGGYLGKGVEAVGRSSGDTQAKPDIIENFVFQPSVHDPPSAVAALPREFSKAAEVYWGHMVSLMTKLMELCSLALELPKDYFEQFYSSPSLALKVSMYPVPSKEERQQPRYGAHTDYQVLTILRPDPLYTAKNGGLEILDASGNWLGCPRRENSFVVNTGDLLQRWTNDRWKSNVHRVAPCGQDEEVTDRLSCVFFTGPRASEIIVPLPTCGAPLYPPITAGEHLAKKLSATNV